tara:strand:- start:89 stop:226 length:138 start_codon:yes stop_codon:yes gene_type:complete
LSPDGEQLIITNKKPISDPEYILEADPDVVEQKKKQHKGKKAFVK